MGLGYDLVSIFVMHLSKRCGLKVAGKVLRCVQPKLAESRKHYPKLRNLPGLIAYAYRENAIVVLQTVYAEQKSSAKSTAISKSPSRKQMHSSVLTACIQDS